MPAYRALTSQTPPAAVGGSKQLWSPDLFDATTGAYPKATPPANVRYPSPYRYFEGAQAVQTWNLSTGDDLLAGVCSAYTARSTKATIEAALWAAGRLSWKALLSRSTTTVNASTGNSSSYDAPLPTPPSMSLWLPSADVVLTVESLAWGDPTDHITSHTDYGPGEWEETDDEYSNVILTIAGAPDLTSLLSVGLEVAWT